MRKKRSSAADAENAIGSDDWNEGPLTVAGFHRALDLISRSHNRYENFINFLEAAYCSYAKPTARTAEQSQALEARYMRIVAKYEPDRPGTMRTMSKLFGRLLQAIAVYDGDFLGQAYMTAEFGNKFSAQYFTPWNVARMMATMMMDRETLERHKVENQPVKIMEPCSGSGVMVIAAAESIRDAGFIPEEIMLGILVDIDPVCMQMAFIQMTAKEIPAVVIHGNGLSGEEFERAYTLLAARNFGMRVWGITETPPPASEQPEAERAIEQAIKDTMDRRLYVERTATAAAQAARADTEKSTEEAITGAPPVELESSVAPFAKVPEQRDLFGE